MSKSRKERIDQMIGLMTLEEKASLCSGEGFWHTKAIERLDIPPVMVSDGPHGLRKKSANVIGAGENYAIQAVCFPTASALACSFDRELIRTLGKALGEECQAEDVAVLLGPGNNMKRSPLCGRNFEYYSEDPYLSAALTTAFVQGVQSRGVGTSLKHFACNNQEHRRMSVSAEIDERTLREIYLAPFEDAVKNAKPWTVMCSYNKINGVYSSENDRLLNKILREEWGFQGLVMSDWGAVNDRVRGVAAGLDLEMPDSMGKNDELLVQAVREGRLEESVLDTAAARVLEIVEKFQENKAPETVWDKEKHHALARKISAQCMVLLKNDGGILPLDAKMSVAFVGKFAKSPRFQGGGSSHINSCKTTSALDAAGEFAHVHYAAGYDGEEPDEALLAEAVRAAKESDVAVVFAGLPDSYESEGYDRTHLRLPPSHLALISRVSDANPNTVVVLHNGAPVEMPWLDKVKGVLEAYLAGQAGGGAVCDILFGKENPSGRLAETFPAYLEQNPSYLNFPGAGDTVAYREGIFIGYRYYDKKHLQPLFPFGYGLSYTEFSYGALRLSDTEMTPDKTLTAEIEITNTGSRRGAEVVQLYVRDPDSGVVRPERELKGFEKVVLAPGQTKRVAFRLHSRAFSYYSPEQGGWTVEAGEYSIEIGASSRDIRAAVSVQMNTLPAKRACPYSVNSTCGDIYATKAGREVFAELFSKLDVGVPQGGEMGESGAEMAEAMYRDMPVHALVSFTQEPSITREFLQRCVDRLNEMFGL